MDKLEEIGHLVIAALAKAQKLRNHSIDKESSQRVEELVKAVKDISERIEVLTEATVSDGKLDKRTIDSALDRIFAAIKVVNDELDQLLEKARR
jgi:hypothetical protein